MEPTWISIVVFVCVFGGALSGMLLQRVLPVHHLSPESNKVIKLAVGLIATLSALVLGLLVGSVHTSFDAKGDSVKRLASQLILLDRVMADYGPETEAARALLRTSASGKFGTLIVQPASGLGQSHVDQITSELESVQRALLKLTPKDPSQQWLQQRALQVSGELEQTRWLLIESMNSSVPTAFLVILVFWLTIIFMNFGLFAPRNGTVLTALILCALSVSCALYLILDMDGAFDGPIQISTTPLKDAVERLNR